MAYNRILPGEKYERWTVIKFVERQKTMYLWLCKCQCGTEKIVGAAGLRQGKSRSCGCLRNDLRKHDDSYYLEFFWNKVEKTDGCWIWKGSKTSGDYGILSVNGKSVYAHRFSYELVHGKIPGKLVIDHLCRHHSCVNPRHLEAVTTGENVWRGVVDRRKNCCVEGHPLTPNNIYVNPTTGKRRCRACRDYKRRLHYLKHKNTKLASSTT